MYGYSKTEKEQILSFNGDRLRRLVRAHQGREEDKEVLRKSKPASKSAKASFSKETSSY